jgi:SAM-dependent methyltransferase
MSVQDRKKWDSVYRKHLDKPLPTPDPLLLQYTPSLSAGDQVARALDVAAGFGQNGLWLAGQGYVVDVMEVSRVALERCRKEAEERGLRDLNLLHVDLDTADIQVNTYRLVCAFRFLHRKLFARLRASVRPGGRIIYQTFNENYLKIQYDFNPEYLLYPGELVGYFSDWHIIHNSEEDHISQLVAIKPDDAVNRPAW